ncbi:unnamed protein product [Fusarium fujikuroi]|uniref:Uncharacterized protein n=1 Tax=Fusarium fujikuroi TaxID=5127 RepID=A0A2H3S9V3_FUSFU|nr:uncharacterized protein FFC1_12003 [Fusarium fujikuroi]VTT64981.1 unnamed protein product [Fusarium fujikuroi]VZH87856.1 unnamed protein product [Fusarium fujikuroi]
MVRYSQLFDHVFGFLLTVMRDGLDATYEEPHFNLSPNQYRLNTKVYVAVDAYDVQDIGDSMKSQLISTSGYAIDVHWSGVSFVYRGANENGSWTTNSATSEGGRSGMTSCGSASN